MRSSVVNYILLLLDSQDSVRIPGVGTLRRRVDPARIDREHRKVRPPYARLDFVYSTRATETLLPDYIAYATGGSKKEAQALVDKFSDQLLQEVQSEGEVAVENLGKFFSKNERLFFTPVVAVGNVAYSGLRVVDLPARPKLATVQKPRPEPAVAVVSMATKTETSVPAAVSTETDEIPVAVASATSNNWRLPIAIPAMVFLLILVTVIAVMNFMSDSSNQYPASAYNRAPDVEPTITPISDDTAYDISRDTQSESSLNIAVDDVVVIGNRIGENQGGISEPSVDVEVGDDDPMEKPSDPEVKEAEIVEFESIPAEGQTGWPGLGTAKCYVIVGAFGVSTNVDRMITRLESMGYSVATMPNRGLTQIGVTSSCDSMQIERVLDDMRANVESQAWVYKR